MARLEGQAGSRISAGQPNGGMQLGVPLLPCWHRQAPQSACSASLPPPARPSPVLVILGTDVRELEGGQGQTCNLTFKTLKI